MVLTTTGRPRAGIMHIKTRVIFHCFTKAIMKAVKNIATAWIDRATFSEIPSVCQ